MEKSLADNITPLLTIAEEAAVSGGQHIKTEYFKSSKLSIKEKKKNDFVTNLDIESEKIIRSIIRKYNTDARIIGEEEGEEGTDSDIEWFVDPLDGTGAFIKGNLGFVSVSVSAVETTTKKLLVGAVYNPFTEILYSASISDKSKLSTNSKIDINRPKSISEARLLLDISENHPLKIREVLTPDNKYFGRILRYDGSFAQHMCLISSGTLDGGIFWGTGKKGTFWDLAASLLICREAGLKVTDLLGQDLSFNSPSYDQVIVASEPLHGQLLDWVTKISAEHNIKIKSRPASNKKSKKSKQTKS